MPLPAPEPGLVLSYAYLWRHEHNRELEEGLKVRPCPLVLSAAMQDGRIVVTVAPMTHRAPCIRATARNLNSTVQLILRPRTLILPS